MPPSLLSDPQREPSVSPDYKNLAVHYCIDDLPEASAPGSRLQNILIRLRLDGRMTSFSSAYLELHGLRALQQFADGELTYDAFRELALIERSLRIEAELAARQAREAEQRVREAAMQAKLKLAREQAEAARRARESDPKYIAKVRNQQLRARYGVDTFIEQDCFGRLMKLLKSVDAGQRLSEEDFVWLSTVAKDYFSEELRAAYHHLEAKFFVGEFQRTRDPWMAVNASGHYRKCERAREAKSLLDAIDVDQQKSPKLKAAICTTHGGVMRDLGCWEEGLRLGERAHAIRPTDYRPCTLLGAIYMETGNYSLGQEWYEKARARGASLAVIDQDLRNIFFRADTAKQSEMRTFLLREDPIRFAWAQPREKAHKRGV
jgi:tetratricopeptide (TPR) repeat protein